MPATAAESTTPPVNTGSGPLNTLRGWAASDAAVAAIAPWYATVVGVPSTQFVDRVTLDDIIARLPPNAYAIQGLNKSTDPVVMLVVKPLYPAYLAPGAKVLITGTGFASIDGKAWPISIVSAALSQFRLMGADTSAETGTATSGTAAPT